MGQQRIPKTPSSENARMLGILFLIFLLLGSLIVVPFVLARYFGVWIGLVAAIAALPGWRYLGPPPMPGFVNGILCLSGYAVLIGQLIAWIAIVIHHIAA